MTSTERTTTPDLAYGDHDPGLGERGDRIRCVWDISVCGMPPVAHIDGPGGRERYCELHYALSLRRLLDLHLPFCPGSAREHVTGFGMDDPGAA